jgi:hypothetical protein
MNNPPPLANRIPDMTATEISELLSTFVRNKLILNDTEENQLLARVILEHLGVPEGMLDAIL